MRENTVMRFGLSLMCLAVCQAQRMRSAGSVIEGILSGDDGTAITGGSVMARRASAPSVRAARTDWHATSGDRGLFRFEGLPDGQYALCAQVPSSTWINPCAWGLRPPVMTISVGRPAASVIVVLKRGVLVPVRVDDPGQRLSQHEGKTPGAHLLLGIDSDASVFQPASVASQDTAGRNYRIVIPFDLPVRLVVGSSFFQMSDAAGSPLPRTGSTGIPVTVSAGQSPGTIRLTVTGASR